MSPQLEYVLRTVEERGVRFVQLWFTDVLGSLKGFAITPAELEGALEEGMTFDGSAIEGYSRVQESDMLAMPDPSTFEIVPWRGDDAPVARMFCDIQLLSGESFDGDPRNVLRRNLQRATERATPSSPVPRSSTSTFGRRPSPSRSTPRASSISPTPTPPTSCARRTILTLEAMGIPVEYSFHENGPSQHEIDLRYTDALSMADNVMTFRMVVKRIASELGVHATFMPKPISGAFGSGMHAHLSLFEGDVNAFHDPGDPQGLSKVGKHFVAGSVAPRARDHRDHEPDGQLLQATHRGVRGAHIHLVGSQQRVGPRARAEPEARQGIEHPGRVPLPGPGVQPVPRVRGDARRRDEGHRRGIRAPRGSDEQHLRDDPAAAHRRGNRSPAAVTRGSDRRHGRTPTLVAEALGEHVFEYFIRNKRREWNAYKEQVTPWEIDRYLGSL